MAKKSVKMSFLDHGVIIVQIVENDVIDMKMVKPANINETNETNAKNV